MGTNSRSRLWFVVLTASLSSIIEWYDLHLFGALVVVFAHNYFPNLEDTFSFLSSLIIFGIGMIVRPVSALFFGWLGDSIGRKYTFLITLVLMGGATSGIGLLPTYNQAQGFAVTLLFLLRVIQGVAMGGEYGASLLLVAEHAPFESRGFYTSIIHCMASFGQALAILTNLFLLDILGHEIFFSWGWRLSFLLSIILVVISYLLRRRLVEPPAFHQLRIAGKTSQNPIYESFHDKATFKKIILALLFPMIGQGVLISTSTTYSNYFINWALKVNVFDTHFIVGISTILMSPFNILFGYLSDRIGRVPIILTGLFFSILSLFPSYHFLIHFSGQLEIVEPNSSFKVKMIMIATLFVHAFFTTMVYGPAAALLVDLFPMRIRFTCVSFCYHVANGIFGSSVPLAAMAINLYSFDSQSLYLGLLYPFLIGVISFTIGLFFFKSPLLREVNK